MKRITCIIVVVSIVLGLSLNVYATNEPIEDADLLNEVIGAVENDIASISKTGNIGMSDSIPLRDMKGNLYAYFVPIFEESSRTVSGYSVISIVGEAKTLTTAVGENSAALAIMIMRESESKGELIYEFPNAFIKHVGGMYYKICIDGSLDYIEVPSEYESNTVEFLSSEYGKNETNRSTVTYGQLKKWNVGSFLPISISGGYYYGGYQGWLVNEGVSQFYANRSCGVTAAANMFCYMAYNKPGMKNLYTKVGISQSQFSAFQREVYSYVSPAIWGIPTLNTMISRVENYAASRGVNLKATRSSLSWTETNVRKYIAGGLNKECPVLLLTWNSPIADLSTHWVTVTRIYNNGSATKIVTSNWAEKQIYDFSTWVNGSSIYKGVIYFE